MWIRPVDLIADGYAWHGSEPRFVAHLGAEFDRLTHGEDLRPGAGLANATNDGAPRCGPRAE